MPSTYTTEQFICKAKSVHNNRYNYNKTNYINSNLKVIITCPVHGDYEQRAADHLHGRGCNICGGTSISNGDIFIQKAKIVHGTKYDYTKVNYINNRTKVIIICNIHGEFSQTPNNHLRGQTCYQCSRKELLFRFKSEVEIDFLNYYNIEEKNRQYKINRYVVDGYEPTTNTIYEFLGNYWHGNLSIYKSDGINKLLNKTFGELNIETFYRFSIIKEFGYNINYIWESDWCKFIGGIDIKPNIITY